MSNAFSIDLRDPIDLLFEDISVLYTMNGTEDSPLGEVRRWSVGFHSGALAYLGPTRSAPDAQRRFDARGLVAVPGLVDPHTHSVWGGSRSDEFERRLGGVSYSEILESGGGILSTVEQTRRSPQSALVADCNARLRTLQCFGVTSVEVKSGYGLNVETELRCLQAATSTVHCRVIPTFLGAHAIPREWRHDRAGYVGDIIENQLPACAQIATAIDVYCDRGAFTLDESVAILSAGKNLGLRVRAHAEQVEHTGISAAAAALGATCVDHLERITEADISVLAENGTTAVLLPGAQMYLRDSSPPIESLREAKVPIAIGTDLNPGSSPVFNPWVTATLACVLQRLTVEETLLGITRHAGRALGEPSLGWLGSGSVADLVIVQPPPDENPSAAGIIQSIGGAQPLVVVQDGAVVHSSALAAARWSKQ